MSDVSNEGMTRRRLPGSAAAVGGMAFAGDLTSALRLDAGKAAQTLPDTTGAYNLAQFEATQLPMPTVPTTNQQIPRQARGHRPHT